MRLQVQRLDLSLPVPRYAYEGDAGLDLYARESVVLAPKGGRATMGTGISVAIDPGFVGLVVPRSGLAARNGVTVLNAPGVVDSGYRGEVFVILVNHDPENAYSVNRGDRIAQLLVTVAPAVYPLDVSHLSDSRRGSGGMGHTGT